MAAAISAHSRRPRGASRRAETDHLAITSTRAARSAAGVELEIVALVARGRLRALRA
jgi:hypothetical protein